MLRYYYINKEWMLSATARRIYRASAMFSILLLVVLWVLKSPIEIPHSFLPIIRLLLLAGVVGTATTMVAMEYFLFGFDTSPAWKKTFWFCVMLFQPIGSSLYCFVVYSRSDVLNRFAHEHRGNAS